MNSDSDATAALEEGVKPTHLRKRHPSEQRYIIRQTAIKCATDLVASKQVPLESLFKYAGRIVAWIYSTPKDPTGGAEAETVA